MSFKAGTNLNLYHYNQGKKDEKKPNGPFIYWAYDNS